MTVDERSGRQRPVIMSSESIRAILASRKTQTRRLIDLREFGPSSTRGYDWTFRDRRAVWQDFNTKRLIESKWCRFRVGERLWVKETWCLAHPDYHSAADGKRLGRPMQDGRWCHYAACDDVDYTDGRSPWRSPLFMPRWASRLTLEVTEVRVQRLQDISDDDARAEGVVSGCIPASGDHPALIGYAYGKDDGKSLLFPSEREAYADEWNRINGKRRQRQYLEIGDPRRRNDRPYCTVVDESAAWNRNPWVWAVTFRRTT